MERLHKGVVEQQRRVQPLGQRVADGLPQPRCLHNAVQHRGKVRGPLYGLILDVRPGDGVQAVPQLLADELADLVPVARLHRVQDAVQKGAFRGKIVVGHNVARTAAAPAGTAVVLVGFLVQHVQLIKSGQLAVGVLDLFRRTARRFAHAAHGLGCTRAGADGLAGKKRHQPRNVAKHHGRRIGKRCQGGHQHRQQGSRRCGRCALQIAQRRPQLGRGQQRRTHPACQRAQAGRQHVEHQRPGHQPCDPVAELCRALGRLGDPVPDRLRLAAHPGKRLLPNSPHGVQRFLQRAAGQGRPSQFLGQCTRRLGSYPDAVSVGDPIALRLCGLLLAFQLGGQVGVALLQGLYGGILGAVVSLGLADFSILRVQLGGQLVAQRFIGSIGHTELGFSPRIQPGVYLFQHGGGLAGLLAGCFQIVPQGVSPLCLTAQLLIHRRDLLRRALGFSLQCLQFGLRTLFVDAGINDDRTVGHSFTSPAIPVIFPSPPYPRRSRGRGF